MEYGFEKRNYSACFRRSPNSAYFWRFTLIEGYVGNLDTIFGLAFWKPLDILYPLTSIMVFLLYGKLKGGLRLNTMTVLVFLSYLFTLALISLGDIILVPNLQITMPKSYWIAAEWFYPIYSSIAFIIFGKINQFK